MANLEVLALDTAVPQIRAPGAGDGYSVPRNITLSNNLIFGSTGQRITGDFSNATLANRLAFQTSTTNGNTTVYALPNGTSQISSFSAVNNSDPTNASITQLLALSTESSLRNAISGTGTYLPMTFYTGGSERMRLDTSGNLGIGTASPGSRVTLGVNATDTALSGTSNTAGLHMYVRAFGVAQIDSIQSGANNSGMSLRTYNNGTYTAFIENTQGNTTTFATAGSERMRIDSSGNVGIGRAPNYTLDVYRSGTTTPTIAAANDNIVNVLRASGSTEAVIGPITSHPLVLLSANTERMRIDATGNVGIGTASPVSKLSVGGNPPSSGVLAGVSAANSISLALSDNTNNSLYVKHVASGAATFGTDSGGQLAFATNGFTERMRIDSSGNVGIGTASPSGNLQVSGANSRIRFSNTSGTASTLLFGADSGQMFLGAETNAPIYFITNNTERMRITAAGNISAGAGALATTATDGFLYVPTCAGTPTGTPTAITGMAPIVVNTTNNKLYFYSGGAWRDAGP